MYEWTQPIGKKVIKWRPLTVGDEMDVQATYRLAENQHLQPYELLRRRILTVSGEEKKCEMGDFRQWDALDLDLFAEEVQRVERDRKAGFMKGSEGPLP